MDWNAITDETVAHLSRLIRAKTINPPGDELQAILVIKDILEREGFPESNYTILESEPGRANLVARLRGDGSQRPLLLSGHVDVVPVEPDHWSRDPFGGEVIDGVVWGRGALDMKGFLAMYLQIFLQAYRRNLPLKRDVILAAIADEEAGFEHGSRFLVDKHRDLIAAEYGLTESGGVTVHLSGARLYPIQVAEKGICQMRMVASGSPGHGSMPHRDNAVFHLSQALEKLRRAGNLPVHLTPPVEAMLEAISGHLGFPLGTVFGLLRHPSLAGILLKRLPGDVSGLITALLTNSVSPTILKAGAKVNVIPSEAEAYLDCRLLLGQKPEDAIGEILAIIGGGIRLEPIYTSGGAEFPLDTPLYHLLEEATRQMDPQGIAFPMLMPGGTDASEYKRAGITMYGFTPGILPPELPVIRLTHGHDERIPVSTIRSGLPVLWQVVNEFCCV
ncbi:MAG: M20/M25/M40 family metallo-hydrolase [Anaerolineales bacterium]|nr:M20/M25/M40 family metallo-hydrolase [Anaerolineales bacterium]